VRRATTLSASNPFSISDNPVLRGAGRTVTELISSSLRSRFAPAKSWSATSSGPSPGVPAWRCCSSSDASFAFSVAGTIRLETLVTLVFGGTLDVIDHEVSHRAFLSSELQA